MTRGLLSTTIMRKHLVGLSGIGLVLFVLGHVTGNLLMFVGPEAYNMYGHKLVTNPLIYLVEVGLITIFLGHAVLAIGLAVRNRWARPTGYSAAGSGGKKTSWVTKSLWAQGVIIVVFVVFHLITFKFGPVYEVTYGDLQVRDLFTLVAEKFQSPYYVVWYILCLLLLGFHLSHGLSSSLQTLGMNHPRYTPWVERISAGVALYVSFGFIAQPLYIYFIYNG